MERYYFHVIDGQFLADEVGTMFPNVAAVRVEALVASGEMLRDLGRRAWAGSEWQMHVTDEANETVLKLSFSTESLGTIS